MDYQKKANLIVLNMDLLPSSSLTEYPRIKEEKSSFLALLQALQEQTNLPLLYCLYSELETRETWQKGLRIFNQIALGLPPQRHIYRALILGSSLYDPYHKIDGIHLESIYPEFDINKTIYLMGENKVSIQSKGKEVGDSLYVESSSLSDFSENLKNLSNQKRREKVKNEL